MERYVTVEQKKDGLESGKNMKESMKPNITMQRKDGSNEETEEKKKSFYYKSIGRKARSLFQEPYKENHKVEAGQMKSMIRSFHMVLFTRLFLEADDLMIRRFLRAHNSNIEKASRMFLRYLEWRRKFIPDGSIFASDIPNEIAQNKIFMQGIDKSGRHIILLFGGRHFPNKKGGLDEFKRFVVFTMDKVCSRISAEHEKFVIIGDLEGWGFSNSDVRGYVEALSILQDCYPERLGKMFIVHVPNIFMTVWKMVYPFITNRTKEKIVFVENKLLKSTLLKDIDENQLPELYGGKMKLVPVQDC